MTSSMSAIAELELDTAGYVHVVVVVVVVTRPGIIITGTSATKS
jgi:hypothetical protein